MSQALRVDGSGGTNGPLSAWFDGPHPASFKRYIESTAVEVSIVASTCSAPCRAHVDLRANGVSVLTEPRPVALSSTFGGSWIGTTTVTWDGTLADGSPVDAGSYHFEAFVYPLDCTDPALCDDTDIEQRGLEWRADLSVTAPFPYDEPADDLADGGVDFIFEGGGPWQQGLDSTVVDAERVAVLRGRIVDDTGTPVVGVRVSAVGQRDYGWTDSRNGGVYDLVVNGAEQLTVSFEKTGFLPVQRTLVVPWNDYGSIEDVVLLPVSSDIHAVTVGASGAQLVSQTATRDGDSRTIYVYVPPGTTFAALDSDGTVLDSSVDDGNGQVHLRVSEFTLGTAGRSSMIAELPESTAFTFAAEVSLDEAEALGATRVEPSNPVIVYVVVGSWLTPGQVPDSKPAHLVPVGYYSRERGAWEPEPNGRFIELLAPVAGGGTQVDAIWDAGAAEEDSGDELTNVGIVLEERAKLLDIYAETGPVQLWRVPLAHFSPFDFNFLQEFTDLAPPALHVHPHHDPHACSVSGSSEIEVQNRVLKESIPLVGASSLHYRSDRAEGAKFSRCLDVTFDDPATTDDDPPASVKEAYAVFQVAGQSHEYPLSLGSLSQPQRYCWDGLDAYGRPVNDTVPATVSVTWVFETGYLAGRDERSFGSSGGSGAEPAALFARLSNVTMDPIGPSRDGQPVTRTWRGVLGTHQARWQRLGGWSLAEHHHLDPEGRRVHFGDGRVLDLSDQRFDRLWVRSNDVSGDWRVLSVDERGSIYYRQGGHLLRVDGTGTGPAANLTSGLAAAIKVSGTDGVFASDLMPNGDLLVAASSTYNGWVELWRIEQQQCVEDTDCVPTGQTTGMCHLGFCVPADPQSNNAGAFTCNADSATCGDGGYLCDFGCAFRELWCPPSTDCASANSNLEFGTVGTQVPANRMTLQPQDAPFGLTVDREGRILFMLETGDTDSRLASLENGVVTLVSRVGPGVGRSDITLDRDGNLLIAQKGCVKRWGAAEPLFGLCGSSTQSVVGVKASEARVGPLTSLDIDSDGNVYVTEDRYSRTEPDGSTVHMGGRVLKLDTGTNTVWCVSGCAAVSSDILESKFGLSDGSMVGNFRLWKPLGVAVAPNGSLVLRTHGDGGSGTVSVTRAGLLVSENPLSTLAEPGTYNVPDPDHDLVHVFDSDGRHLETRHALTGATLLTFGYDVDDKNGKLVSVTDAQGRTTSILRDGDRVATAIVGPLDNTGSQTTALIIDGDGLLRTVAAPDGREWQLEYAPGGLLDTFTTPRNETSTYSYDTLGLLNTALSPDGFSRSFVETLYNGARDVTVTSARGRTTTYGRGLGLLGERELVDANGLVTTGTIAHLSPSSVSEYDYDVTSPSGVRQRSDLSADPRLGVWRPYVSHSHLTVPAELSGSTQLDLDVTVASTLTPGPTGSLYDFTLDATVAVDDGSTGSPFTSTSSVVADPTFQQWSATRESPSGVDVTTSFDSLGRVLEVDPTDVPPAEGTSLLSVDYEYFSDNGAPNTAGRLYRIARGDPGTDPDARYTEYGYDEEGRVDSVSNALSLETGYGYDAAGRVDTITLPDNRVISMAYDANGNVTTVTPPSNQAHGLSHTASSALASYDPPERAATTYAYNQDRQLELVTRPDASTITYKYGDDIGVGGNRLYFVDASDSSSGYKEYTYDSQGRFDRVYWDEQKITLTHQWDGELLRTVEWSDTSGVIDTVEFTYDNQQRLASERAAQTNITFAYDADGRLSRAGDYRVKYRSDGLPTETCIGTWSGSTCSTGVRERFTYNAFGDVTERTVVRVASGTVVQSLFTEALTFDRAGRIATSREDVLGVTGVVRRYIYDDASRLVRVDDEASPGVWDCVYEYVYDVNGNRTAFYEGLCISESGTPTAQGSYDDEDALRTYGGVDYLIDDNGVLELTEDGATIVNYEYGAFGNLRSVKDNNSLEVLYFSDAFDRRVHRRSQQAGSTYWVYADGLRIIGELDDNLAPWNRYVYGLVGHVPAYAEHLGGAGPGTVALIGDARGSLRLAVDLGTGDVLQQVAYTPFGRELSRTGLEPWLTPFGYAGGLTDPETGLVRFGARDYDAWTGRWTARDPIGFGGGDVNLYGYVLNDPVNRIDPTGLWADPFPPDDPFGGWMPGDGDMGDFTIGFTVQAAIVATLFEDERVGGVFGVNFQVFCEPPFLEVYWVYTRAEDPAVGWDVGLSAQPNIAYGEGPWDGEFENVGGGWREYVGGAFWSPGKGGWTGISGGFGYGLPASGSYTRTFYEKW